MRTVALTLAVAAVVVGLSAARSAAGPGDCKNCVGGTVVVGGLIHPGVGARSNAGNRDASAQDLRCADLLVVGTGRTKKTWSAFAVGDITDGICAFALPAGAAPTSIVLKAWPSGKTIESLLLGGSVKAVFHVEKSELERVTGRRFAEDRR